MSGAFIVDAHVHTGAPNVFYSPEIDAERLLARMDELGIRFSVNLGSAKNFLQASAGEMQKAQVEFEQSGGRIFYCGYFDARRAKEDLDLLDTAARGSGFRGIKIHPSFSKVPADDPRFDAVWRFAAERGLPIVSHTWSASSYNPVQVLSTPERFLPCVEKYPSVRFVLGHSGGRGEGRRQAIRMARQYPHVYVDISGDIMDRHFLEQMAREGVAGKVLFGSDYPWLDQRAHLSCVYLAGIPVEAKRLILRDNGLAVFGLPAQ
jgi:uncharacterized protein